MRHSRENGNPVAGEKGVDSGLRRNDRAVLRSYLSVTEDNPFIGRQLFKPHRTAGVQLLCAYPHLRPQSELTAVGEPGAGVNVHTRGVHLVKKTHRAGVILGDDSLGMPRAVTFDMFQRLVQRVHYFYRCY